MKKQLLFIAIAVFTGVGLFGQQVQNPGFENWEDAGASIDEPTEWSSLQTSDNSIINPLAPVVWGQSSDAHTGNYALKLFNVTAMGTIVATGAITNGRVHAEFDPSASYMFTDPNDEQWHTVLTTRPDSVVVWAKYTPVNGDTANVKVLLHVDEGTLPPLPENQGNWIAFAQISIVGTVDTWTRFSVPFTYFSNDNPQYMLIVATAGADYTPQDGSTVLYDDFELIYNSTGIEEQSGEDFLVYSDNDHSIILNEKIQNSFGDATLQLFSLNGKLVWKGQVSSNRIILSGSVHSGLYIVKVNSKAGSYSQKLFLK